MAKKPSCTKSKAYLALQSRLEKCKKSPRLPNLWHKNGKEKGQITLNKHVYRLVGYNNSKTGARARIVRDKKGKMTGIKELKTRVKKEKAAVKKEKVAVKKEKIKIKKEKAAVKKEKVAVKKEKAVVKKVKAAVTKSNAMEVENKPRTYTPKKIMVTEEDNSNAYSANSSGIKLDLSHLNSGKKNMRSKTELALKNDLNAAQQVALMKGLPTQKIKVVTKKAAVNTAKITKKKATKKS